MSGKYILVSGIIFGLVAVAHFWRVLMQLPINIGGTEIPLWVSWIAAIVAGALCVWAFQNRK